MAKTWTPSEEYLKYEAEEKRKDEEYWNSLSVVPAKRRAQLERIAKELDDIKPWKKSK